MLSAIMLAPEAANALNPIIMGSPLETATYEPGGAIEPGLVSPVSLL
jgi:hypothetical protein